MDGRNDGRVPRMWRPWWLTLCAGLRWRPWWLTLCVGIAACLPSDPEPFLLAGEDGGQTHAGACTKGGGETCLDQPCDGERYPCGPYGAANCDVVLELSFQAVNEPAQDLADDDGNLSLGHFFRDNSTAGLLLFGTAGWCTFCAEEAAWLNRAHPYDGNADGRIQFVAVVFQDDVGAPATVEYGRRYAGRYGFPFPAVVDSNGAILDYFDAALAPGNVFIDATTMRLRQVVQGFDRPVLTEALRRLDGLDRCR